MAEIIKLTADHPLVGTWVSADGDSAAEFTIVSTGSGLTVTGRDRDDGEEFIVNEILWDGEKLRFSTLMPSTGYRARHAV